MVESDTCEICGDESDIVQPCETCDYNMGECCNWDGSICKSCAKADGKMDECEDPVEPVNTPSP